VDLLTDRGSSAYNVKSRLDSTGEKVGVCLSAGRRPCGNCAAVDHGGQQHEERRIPFADVGGRVLRGQRPFPPQREPTGEEVLEEDPGMGGRRDRLVRVRLNLAQQALEIGGVAAALGRGEGWRPRGIRLLSRGDDRAPVPGRVVQQHPQRTDRAIGDAEHLVRDEWGRHELKVEVRLRVAIGNPVARRAVRGDEEEIPIAAWARRPCGARAA